MRAEETQAGILAGGGKAPRGGILWKPSFGEHTLTPNPNSFRTSTATELERDAP